jgi:hypothetical protein
MPVPRTTPPSTSWLPLGGCPRYGELAVTDGFVAGGADGQWLELGAAGVLEDDRLGSGVDVSVAPLFEREQDGPKGLPGVSQEVLVAWRTLRILPALDHACLFEFAQPCGEHVAVPRCSWLCLESGCVRSESRGPPAMHSGSPQG